MPFFTNQDILRDIYNQVAQACLDDAVRAFQVMHDGAEPDAVQCELLKKEMAKTACFETGLLEKLAVSREWNAAAFASGLPSREWQELGQYIDRKCAEFEGRAKELEQRDDKVSQSFAALDRRQAAVICKTAALLFPRPLLY